MMPRLAELALSASIAVTSPSASSSDGLVDSFGWVVPNSGITGGGRQEDLNYSGSYSGPVASTPGNSLSPNMSSFWLNVISSAVAATSSLLALRVYLSKEARKSSMRSYLDNPENERWSGGVDLL